jgi:hypothetical protein
MPRIISNESEYVRDLQEISNPIEADILTNTADILTNTGNISTVTGTANAALAKAGGTLTGRIFAPIGNYDVPSYSFNGGSAGTFCTSGEIGLLYASRRKFGCTAGGVIIYGGSGAGSAVLEIRETYVNCFQNLDMKTNAINNISDSRHKNSIEPLSIGLDFINSLNPVSFKYNDTVQETENIEHSRRHTGFIAQEVEMAVISSGETLQTVDMVDNDFLLDNTAEDIYKIRHAAFISPMVKAIQELSAQVSALKTRIELLESA